MPSAKLETKNLQMKSSTAANSSYPKGGDPCSKDSLVVNGSSVFQIKFSVKSTALRVAANRWHQV
jgi:hypothetical protein